MKYFDLVKDTYIEAWPSALCSLSIAQVDIPLTLQDAEDLGASIVEYCETFPAPWGRDLTSLRNRLDGAICRFPHGAFVRLGSRSPKDAWGFNKTNGLVRNGTEAIALLTDCSERISDDLHLAISSNYAPHVFVRQWLTIPTWSEFRCFQKAGKLVGVSQYNYRDYYQEITERHDTIIWAIKNFHGQHFQAACHLTDVVFDVIVKIKKTVEPSGMTVVDTEVKLLEINPFLEMTDPALFDWRSGGDFDNTFRMRAPDGPAKSREFRKISLA